MAKMSHEELKDYFLAALKHRITGLEVCGWTDDLTVDLKVGGLERQIYLGNKIKDYEGRNDIAVIDGFVDHIANLDVEKSFDKEYILSHLLVMIQPNDLTIRDAVSYDCSQQTKVFVVYQEGDDGGLHFLLQSDLKKHGFLQDELVRLGIVGIDREIARATVKEVTTSWGSYFYFETAKEYLKASFILGSTLLDALKPYAPDPVIMVSNRDCLYVTDAKNTDLISRISTICVRDYGSVGYPISTEAFGVRDGKVVALGAYK